MGAVLAAAGRQLDAAAEPAREVVLVTDLRKAGWDPAVASAAESLAKIGARLRVVDCGEDSTEDVAVERARDEHSGGLPGTGHRDDREDPELGPRKRFGPASAQLRFGASERTVALPRIEAGAEALVTFAVSFDRPGAHAVSVTLPEDALPADGLRLAVVWVREHLDVVIVDGEPSVQPFESESDFVAAALGVGDLPVRVRVAHDSEWLSQPPEAADLDDPLQPRVDAAGAGGAPRSARAQGDGAHRSSRAIRSSPTRGTTASIAAAPASFRRRSRRRATPASPGSWWGRPRASPLDPLRRLAPGALSSIQGAQVPRALAARGLRRRASSRGGRGRRTRPRSSIARRRGPRRLVDDDGRPRLVGLADRSELGPRGARDGVRRGAPRTSPGSSAKRARSSRSARGPRDATRASASPARTGSRGRGARGNGRRHAAVRSRGARRSVRAARSRENGADVARTVAVNPVASEAALARWDRDALRRFARPLATDVGRPSRDRREPPRRSRELWRTLIIAAVALFLLGEPAHGPPGTGGLMPMRGLWELLLGHRSRRDRRQTSRPRLEWAGLPARGDAAILWLVAAARRHRRARLALPQGDGARRPGVEAPARAPPRARSWSSPRSSPVPCSFSSMSTIARRRG